MKVKLSDQSIRFRFSKNELQELGVGHRIQMDVYFSYNQKIIFQVDMGRDVKEISLSCINQVVSLKIPIAVIQQVIEAPSKNGFETSLPIAENKNIKIQIQCDLKH